jgi:hypothetical protein
VALVSVPLDGGEERQLANDVAGTLSFVVGRRAVYFMVTDRPRTTTKIDAIDVATGQRTTLATVGKPPWFGMTLSPDQRLLLLSVVNDENLDLMLVDPPS